MSKTKEYQTTCRIINSPSANCRLTRASATFIRSYDYNNNNNYYNYYNNTNYNYYYNNNYYNYYRILQQLLQSLSLPFSSKLQVSNS